MGTRNGDRWRRSFRLRVRVGEIRSRRSGGTYAAAVEVMAEFGFPSRQTRVGTNHSFRARARFLQGKRNGGAWKRSSRNAE